MYLRYFFKDSNTTKPNHPFKMESEFTPSLPDNENFIEYMSLVYNDLNTHDNNNQKSLHRNFSREEMSSLKDLRIERIYMIFISIISA